MTQLYVPGISGAVNKYFVCSERLRERGWRGVGDIWIHSSSQKPFTFEEAPGSHRDRAVLRMAGYARDRRAEVGEDEGEGSFKVRRNEGNLREGRTSNDRDSGREREPMSPNGKPGSSRNQDSQGNDWTFVVSLLIMCGTLVACVWIIFS